MNLKTIDTFIKNGSFGYARYHVVGGVIKMTAHNLTLSKLLGEEVVSNLQEEGHDIQSSLISVIRQWLYMVQQVAEDGKIRIFTTLLSNPNQHYRFLVFSMESNHITTLILELPTSRNDL